MLQISDFRRGILAPLDNDSICVGCGVFQSPVRVEYIIIGDELFNTLWLSEIFQKINTACGIQIDDYEETKIAYNLIPLALEVLSKNQTDITDENLLKFITMLELLMQNAIKNKVDIWFVL